jgi:hypothetical protein
MFSYGRVCYRTSNQLYLWFIQAGITASRKVVFKKLVVTELYNLMFC